MSTIERCLSIRQPWAWAIVSGRKPVENRSWATPYRGRIAIHASQASVPSGDRWHGISHLFDEPRSEIVQNCRKSCIVGSVEVWDCVYCSEIDFGEPADGKATLPESAYDWCDTGVVWLLRNPIQYAKPIPAGGKLNLWKLDYTLKQAVAAAERTA